MITQLNVLGAVVSDPCESTVLASFILDDMEGSVLGLENTQTFPEVTDSESELAGGADETGTYLCGPRIYTIMDAQPFLWLDQASRTLSLVTDDVDAIDQYTIRV